jgi:hypothetical protein
MQDDEIEMEIVRVDGRAICPICGKEYRDHPTNPKALWPTFVQLCDGRIGKT